MAQVTINLPTMQNWRSRVWAHCYEVLALVTEGSMPVPENSEFLASLPHI